MTAGTPIIFREGCTRGIGVIKRVIYDDDEVKAMKIKSAGDVPVVTPPPLAAIKV